MSNTKVRINLKAYDHRLLDSAALKIVETVKALEKGAQDWFSKMNDWEFEKTVRMYSER